MMEPTEQIPVAWPAEKPKRIISPEHKAKMAAGRLRAKEERAVRKEKAAKRSEDRRDHKAAVDEIRESAPFIGLTKTDCPVGCTSERCAIGGSLVMKNPDGTTTLVGHCCHPCNGGLGPIHKTKPEIVGRYNRARKYLAHMEIDKRP